MQKCSCFYTKPCAHSQTVPCTLWHRSQMRLSAMDYHRHRHPHHCHLHPHHCHHRCQHQYHAFAKIRCRKMLDLNIGKWQRKHHIGSRQLVDNESDTNFNQPVSDVRLWFSLTCAIMQSYHFQFKWVPVCNNFKYYDFLQISYISVWWDCYVHMWKF